MATMTLARIEEEIIKQRLMLSELCTQKNSFSFIFRLPTETLEDIFIHYARDYYHNDDCVLERPSWVNISYVCRRWRDVALNCPTLWTHISTMSWRWTEEFLVRSKQASLKIRIELSHSNDILGGSCSVGKVMEHIERIRELSLDIRVLHSHGVFSKLTSRAPRLRKFQVLVRDYPLKMTLPSLLLFDGDTPALRTLELLHCPAPWSSLKLGGLTALSLHRVPGPLQQDVEQFLATLRCIPELKHLSLIRALPSSRELTSTAVFNTFKKIDLPHLSRLSIEAPLSTVIALLSCVNIPLNTQAKLECTSEVASSLDDYTTLSSLLAKRLGGIEGQPRSGPIIRSLVIESTRWGPRFTFSGSECGCDSLVSKPSTEWDCTIPLQLFLAADLPFSKICNDRILGDICCSIPLTHVQRVHFIDPPFSSSFWKHVLGHFRNVCYLKLSRGDMPDLASLLSLIPHDITESPDGYVGGNPHQTVAPALEELALDDIAFASNVDLQALENALSFRKHPEIELTLTDCIEYPRPPYCETDDD